MRVHVVHQGKALPEAQARLWLCLNLRTNGSTVDDLCWQTDVPTGAVVNTLKAMRRAGLVRLDGKRWKMEDSGAAIVEVRRGSGTSNRFREWRRESV